MFTQHRDNLYKAIGTECAFLSSGVSQCRYDTDRDIQFRQESNFYYFTGYTEPDCFALFNGEAKSATLFIPKLGADHALWVGKIEPNESIEARLSIKVLFIEELEKELGTLQNKTFHIIQDIPTIPNYKVPNPVNDLKSISGELRLIKDSEEIKNLELSSIANKEAFTFIMSNFKAGMYEYEVEGMHKYIVAKHGCKVESFECITATGSNASTLHWVNNSFQSKAGDTFLCDAGCEYNLYASDNTRVFPVSKRFTQKQENLYETVLTSNKVAIASIKPGIKMEELHLIALAEILKGLRKHGLVKEELSFDEQMSIGIPCIFQPHGLGHLMGLDVHDIGAFTDQFKRSTDPRCARLRTTRIMVEGMVITIEPGLYFIDGFLDAAKVDPKKSQHLNFDVIEEYRKECGGYRIEDDILVTKDGHYIFPSAVKEIQDIYKLRDQAFSE
ncbi:Xaa-Pro dipeptidase [Spironucleus salmonicida]|uniref:Xaa-Pro dipeptidase n=1 Tax=Spironucleus salmonicida TaxID=348837 RepID=V6LHC9_9EUKA|nr:Xaa-Pro dipeptidase [Spironucleus salmonicida]|eukprot:EST43952.1 Xaa-Pro dipeptidase [Spironucleus salmonicida]